MNSPANHDATFGYRFERERDVEIALERIDENERRIRVND